MIPTRLSFLEVLKYNSKEHERIFKYGAITLYGATFQRLLLINNQLIISLRGFLVFAHKKTPDTVTLQPLTFLKK